MTPQCTPPVNTHFPNWILAQILPLGRVCRQPGRSAWIDIWLTNVPLFQTDIGLLHNFFLISRCPEFICITFVHHFLFNSCSALLCAAQSQHNLSILQYVRTYPKCSVASATFRTSAACQLTSFLDCWSLPRAPCCRIPRTANTQIQELQIPKIITFKTFRTACLALHLVASTAEIHRYGQAYRQKRLASTSCSIWLHPLSIFVPSTLLEMAQLLQCSPCLGYNDKAFSQCRTIQLIKT